MPVYEYSCEHCAKTFEQLQKFSDPPLTVCPDCQGPVTKLISRTSFQLKGGGWYASDYKKNTAPTPSPVPKDATSEKKGEASATPAPQPAAKKADGSGSEK
jgi:putative FmdB family regulatory protein